MEFILATQNPNKVRELRTVIPDTINIIPLPSEFEGMELPETQNTLEGNALQKARFVFGKTGKPAIADDTGLEVQALEGRPGVFSARYAGPENDSKANMAKLLDELSEMEDRRARFRTVVAVVTDLGEFTVEGIAEGMIVDEPMGDDGFGYDPIFRPTGSERTFGEMDLSEKSALSHRTKAIQALIHRIS